MELKLFQAAALIETGIDFNRTNMELKLFP